MTARRDFSRYGIGWMRDVAAAHGLVVHDMSGPEGEAFIRANGRDTYEDSCCIVANEVCVGIYRDPELRLAGFFHEVGHAISGYRYRPGDSRTAAEEAAWNSGLALAVRLGVVFDERKVGRYRAACVQSHREMEELERPFIDVYTLSLPPPRVPSRAEVLVSASALAVLYILLGALMLKESPGTDRQVLVALSGGLVAVGGAILLWAAKKAGVARRIAEAIGFRGRMGTRR